MSVPLLRHVSVVLFVTGTFVTAGLAACSSGGSGQGFGDDASGGSSTSSSGSGSTSSSGATSSSGSTSSSGGSTSSGGSSSSGSGRVPSNVQFDDAGTPLCPTPCNLKSHICCIGGPTTQSCIAPDASCPSTSIAGFTVTEATFKCVQKSDCPGNQICCGVADSNAGTAGSQCEDVSATGGKCTPATTATTGSAQLCTTNAECKSGQCIWQDCMVGILTPSLTMCGIQSAAPFNCTKH